MKVAWSTGRSKDKYVKDIEELVMFYHIMMCAEMVVQTEQEKDYLTGVLLVFGHDIPVRTKAETNWIMRVRVEF